MTDWSVIFSFRINKNDSRELISSQLFSIPREDGRITRIPVVSRFSVMSFEKKMTIEVVHCGLSQNIIVVATSDSFDFDFCKTPYPIIYEEYNYMVLVSI